MIISNIGTRTRKSFVDWSSGEVEEEQLVVGGDRPLGRRDEGLGLVADGTHLLHRLQPHLTRLRRLGVHDLLAGHGAAAEREARVPAGDAAERLAPEPSHQGNARGIAACSLEAAVACTALQTAVWWQKSA